MLERGRRLGVDVGSVRVGVAICDPDGLIATPLVTLPQAGALEGVIELIDEYEVVALVLGMPKHLKGHEGAAAQAARAFAQVLETRVSIPIHFVDERLTSAAAIKGLSEAGISTRDQRGVVDQVAAAAILQLYLDSNRA